MIHPSTRIVIGRHLKEVPLGVFDLTADRSKNLVDESIVQVTLETPADVVHKIFRQLGNKVIVVVDKMHVAGLITKKSFIRHMEELHAAHDAHNDEHESPVKKALKEPAQKGHRRGSTLKGAE